MSQVSFFVMAGGRGERLRPLTDVHPKPLVRFGASSRIIDFTLHNSLESGGRRVTVLAQYLGGQLEEYVPRKWGAAFHERGARLEVVNGSTSSDGGFLGTAHSVYEALAKMPELPDYAMVLAGDHVYRMDYRPMVKFHLGHGGGATVATVPVPRNDAHRFGIVMLNGGSRVKSFVEKPRSLEGVVADGRPPMGSMGIYVFTVSELMPYLEEQRSLGRHDFGGHVVPEMAKDGRVHAYAFRKKDGSPGYWRDVGDVSAYLSAQLEMLLPAVRAELMDSTVIPPPLWSDRVIKNLAGRARIINSVVSPEADVGRAELRDCVVARGARLDDGVRLRRSVILDGAAVKTNLAIKDMVVEPGRTIERVNKFSASRARRKEKQCCPSGRNWNRAAIQKVF